MIEQSGRFSGRVYEPHQAEARQATAIIVESVDRMSRDFDFPWSLFEGRASPVEALESDEKRQED